MIIFCFKIKDLLWGYFLWEDVINIFIGDFFLFGGIFGIGGGVNILVIGIGFVEIIV